MIEVKIKKLEEQAVLPQYASVGDAGMDLFSLEEVFVENGKRAKIKTGIAMEIPHDYVGFIWDKSSIGINNGLKTLGGVVDSGYRGEVLVGIVNLSSEDFKVEKGQKIAQMIIQKKEEVEIKEVLELNDSERGENGFGSSGKYTK